MSAADRRARFRELHSQEQLFVMPNPWDVGSARLLASCGFEALATTSAGLAWSLGKLDQAVSRDELVAHVSDVANATPLPLNVDSERCYPDDPGGVAETVALLAGAGASGCSIEDYDPVAGRIDDVEVAAERVAIAAQAAHGLPDPMVLTGRAENHIRGVDDLDDTIARLLAYRDAGADAVYAPGLHDLDADRGRRRGSRRSGERPRASNRADRRGAGIGGRASGLDRRLAGGRGLRSAARGRARVARGRNLDLHLARRHR